MTVHSFPVALEIKKAVQFSPVVSCRLIDDSPSFCDYSVPLKDVAEVSSTAKKIQVIDEEAFEELHKYSVIKERAAHLWAALQHRILELSLISVEDVSRYSVSDAMRLSEELTNLMLKTLSHQLLYFRNKNGADSYKEDINHLFFLDDKCHEIIMEDE